MDARPDATFTPSTSVPTMCARCWHPRERHREGDKCPAPAAREAVAREEP